MCGPQTIAKKIIVSNGQNNYHNPSLGLVTKVRACKGAGQECRLGATFHALGSVGKCEGMNPHTPKQSLTFEIKVSMDFQIFRGR
jgi:hypothetical protein